MHDIWRSEEVARRFLSGRAKAIPLAETQGEILLRLLGASTRPVNRFADVGCGAGRIARLILDAFPESRGVLNDFSDTMLRAARAAMGDCLDRVKIVKADLADAGWREALAPNGPYDTVVSGFAIHHLPHERKRSLYADIFQLLAPGGVFVNLEHVASASTWAQRVHDEYFVDHAFSAGVWESKSRREALAEYTSRPDREANILAPLGTQLGWLREIGFEDVDCFFKCFELSIFGGRRGAKGGG